MMSLKMMMLLFGVTITAEEPNKNRVVVRRMHNGHRSKDAIMVEDIPAARAEEEWPLRERREERRIRPAYGLEV
jgi:hypothetical protein